MPGVRVQLSKARGRAARPSPTLLSDTVSYRQIDRVTPGRKVSYRPYSPVEGKVAKVSGWKVRKSGETGAIGSLRAAAYIGGAPSGTAAVNVMANCCADKTCIDDTAAGRCAANTAGWADGRGEAVPPASPGRSLTLGHRARAVAATLLALTLLATGCTTSNRRAEQFGKTFYLDGAGNWGFGASEVPEGLMAAGYAGDVEIYIWTTSFVPLVDQLNIGAAKIRALALADKIKRYHRAHPDTDINLIALSAGTGVATWAVESLADGVRINNLVLLGSSLSHDYDVSKALQHMTGKVYVYSSPNDTVLQTVKLVGTIDGKRGVDSAGAVGLTPPPGYESRVVNVPWSREWLRYGWTGAHTDCTNIQFVRHEIAKHVVSEEHARLRSAAQSQSSTAMAAEFQ